MSLGLGQTTGWLWSSFVTVGPIIRSKRPRILGEVETLRPSKWGRPGGCVTSSGVPGPEDVQGPCSSQINSTGAAVAEVLKNLMKMAAMNVVLDGIAITYMHADPIA